MPASSLKLRLLVQRVLNTVKCGKESSCPTRVSVWQGLERNLDGDALGFGSVVSSPPCSIDKQVHTAFEPAEQTLASTASAAPCRQHRDPASTGTSRAGVEHGSYQPRQQLCQLCGSVANPTLASRRGLRICVDTRWRKSEDGIPRITLSAASRYVGGSSAGSASSRLCSSCAGESRRTAAEASCARHVGKGELDYDASASHSPRVSISSSTSAGSASPSVRCQLDDRHNIVSI